MYLIYNSVFWNCSAFFLYVGEDLFNGISADSDKLKIFQSDPFDYHSIIDALRGCSGLFYTFEPPLDQPNYDVSKNTYFFPFLISWSFCLFFLSISKQQIWVT
jgi:hypothetical protein